MVRPRNCFRLDRGGCVDDLDDSQMNFEQAFWIALCLFTSGDGADFQTKMNNLQIIKIDRMLFTNISDEDLLQAAFDIWWKNEGSGIVPLRNEDVETHVRRVSRIAWLNGAYKAVELLKPK
jgi:hypothetical protein